MTSTYSETGPCIFCDTTYTHYGNNPAPRADTGRACDSCNTNIVIPSRLGFIPIVKKEEKLQAGKTCIDCDGSVGSGWCCEQCGLHTCDECCCNKDGYILCRRCDEDGEDVYECDCGETIKDKNRCDDCGLCADSSKSHRCCECDEDSDLWEERKINHYRVDLYRGTLDRGAGLAGGDKFIKEEDAWEYYNSIDLDEPPYDTYASKVLEFLEYDEDGEEEWNCLESDYHKDFDKKEEEDDYGIGWCPGWGWSGNRWKWDGTGDIPKEPTAPPPDRYWEDSRANWEYEEEELKKKLAKQKRLFKLMDNAVEVEMMKHFKGAGNLC
mgnify:CR=1 FL=1